MSSTNWILLWEKHKFGIMWELHGLSDDLFLRSSGGF